RLLAVLGFGWFRGLGRFTVFTVFVVGDVVLDLAAQLFEIVHVPFRGRDGGHGLIADVQRHAEGQDAHPKQYDEHYDPQPSADLRQAITQRTRSATSPNPNSSMVILRRPASQVPIPLMKT